MTKSPSPRPRRESLRQFTLRGLLAAITGCALVLGLSIYFHAPWLAAAAGVAAVAWLVQWAVRPELAGTVLWAVAMELLVGVVSYQEPGPVERDPSPTMLVGMATLLFIASAMAYSGAAGGSPTRRTRNIVCSVLALVTAFAWCIGLAAWLMGQWPGR